MTVSGSLPRRLPVTLLRLGLRLSAAATAVRVHHDEPASDGSPWSLGNLTVTLQVQLEHELEVDSPELRVSLSGLFQPRPRRLRHRPGPLSQ